MKFDSDRYRYPTLAVFGYGLAVVTGKLLDILTSIFIPVQLIALAVLVIVGGWDLLVWLTNSSWLTTEFLAPLYTIAVIAGCSVLLLSFRLLEAIIQVFGFSRFDDD